MSFADELRNAPKNREKELLREYVDLYYKYIKDMCKYMASRGETTMYSDQGRFFDDYIEGRYEEIEEHLGKYMSQNNADEMKRILTDRFKKDGFKRIEIKYERKQQYRSEVYYRERTEKEKTLFRVSNFLTGANEEVEGSYKTRMVPAGYRYYLVVELSW